MADSEQERRRRVRECFMEAAEALEGERAGVMDRLCAGDAELRREVEGLLRADREAAAGKFMSDPTREAALATAVSLTERPGTQIGPYKLLQLIGEGGFGAVFMADQEKPMRRRVALKIIKLGMDTRQVVARFEQEREALAMMDHPNIARVLDAGATESGRPYFVMEYVKGDQVIAFADAHKLSVRDRLEVFTQVCAAVQHAHTKGIIHRDIKPSNVLASMVDGRPFVKVIDFGIAKATGAAGGRLTEKTLFTEHRQLIGTPEYMSPEQAEGSPDIDTRTDVYGLGVLLYELLTGLTPFDASRLRSAAFAEMQRIIKEEEPPAPSLRISRSLGVVAQTAAARRVEPARLNSLVKGELDWIVMKALDKDRGRRYETASGLADDVRRHLAGEAVVAAPPGLGYRVRKFVRRNKGPVVAGGAVGLTLMAGIVATTFAMRRAVQLGAEAEHQATVAGSNAARAEMARLKAEAQRDFAARSGRALLALLNGDSESDDLSYVRAIHATPESEPAAFDPDAALRDVGADLKALAALSLDTAHRVVDTNTALDNQRQLAEQSAYVANIAAAASDPHIARRYLDACPKRLRGWEWRYLERASESSAWTILNEGSVRLHDVYPDDGRLVSSRPRGGGIQVQEMATGRMVYTGLDGWGINFARVSPDGRFIGFTGIDRTAEKQPWRLAILDTETGAVSTLATLEDDSWLSFVSGGSHLITVRRFHGDGSARIRVWDAATGELCQTIEGCIGGYAWGAASPRSDRIVVRSRETVELWNVVKAERLMTLDVPASSFGSSAFTPDASNVLILADGVLHAWRVDGGEKLFAKSIGPLDRFEPGGRVWSFSRDGARVALSGWGSEARVFETSTGDQLARIPFHPQEVWFDAELSPDGARLLTTGGGIPHLWDVASGRFVTKYAGHTRIVREARFSPDGKWVVTIADDGAVRTWPVDARPNPLVLRVPRGPGDGEVSGTYDPTVQVKPGCLEVRPVPGTQVADWYSPAGSARVGTERFGITSVAFAPDGARLLFTAHASVFEYDLQAMALARERCHLDEFGGHVWMGPRLLGPDASGTFWSWRQSVVKWHPARREPLWRVVHPTISGFNAAARQEERIAQVYHAEVSRDGRRLLVVKDHGAVWPKETPGRGRTRPNSTMCLYDAGTGALLVEREWNGRDRLAGLNFDGSLIAYLGDEGGNNVCRVLESTSGREVAAFQPGAFDGGSCVFSPGGTRLILINSSAAQVWNVQTGQREVVHENRRFDSTSSLVRFSADGSRTVLVMGGTVMLMDTESGREVAELTGHFDTISDATFSPDGRRVATVSHDQTIRIWDGATGQLMMLMREQAPVLDDEGGVGYPKVGFSSVAFSPDGARLAVGTIDGRVLVYDTVPSDEQSGQGVVGDRL